jgi:hypothetical protein
MKDSSVISLFDLSSLTVLIEIFENWSAEPNNVLVRLSCRRLPSRISPMKNVMYTVYEQIVFVTKVSVKRGLADVGAVENLFDRDSVIVLFVN